MEIGIQPEFQILDLSLSPQILQTYKQRDFLGLSEIKFRYSSGCGLCGTGECCHDCGEGVLTQKLGPMAEFPISL